MNKFVSILILFLINLSVMSQNKTVTTKETSFSTSTSFFSSLDKLQHKKVLSYLNKRLGNSDLKKENYEIWLV